MKAIDKTYQNKNLILLSIVYFSGCIVSLCIFLHITPVNIMNYFGDFASHHHFLVFLISLTVLLVSLRLYYQNLAKENKENPIKQETRKYRLLKKMERVNQYSKTISLKIETLKSHSIEKDQLPSLIFSELDVLNTRDEVKKREEDLQQAMKLGNTFKQKVKIFVKDIYSNKHFESTVWHANNKHVTLKGGIIIPVKSIYKVNT